MAAPTFSDDVKTLMVLSREESARLEVHYIGTEHLLLGIVKSGAGDAVELLRQGRIDMQTLKRSLEAYAGTGSSRRPRPTDMPFAPRAKQVLETAVVEMKELGGLEVRPVHVLLAMLRDREGVAGQVPNAFGLDHAAARREIEGGAEPS